MQIKNFIKKVAISFGLFILLAYIIQAKVDNGLSNCYNREPFCSWNLVAKGEAASEIVFLGSSRVKKHIDVPLFEKLSNKKTFNLGLDGANIFLQQALWNLYCSKNALPKVLFLELDYIRLEKDKKIFDKYRFLPYLQFKSVSDIVLQIDGFEIADKYLPLYKYRGYQEYILFGLNNSLRSDHFKQKNSCLANKGFEALNGRMKDSLKQRELYRISNEDVINSLEIINQINNQLKANGSKLILINSPVFDGGYIDVINEQACRKRVEDFLKHKKIEFQDYQNFKPISLDSKYFYDKVHLNFYGAKIFTRQLFEINKKIIND